MASSAFFIFLLFSTTISSPQIYARDSKFFSKVTSEEAQNVAIPYKEQEQQQPEFLPQNENGYGLYGHETSLNNDKDDTFRTEQFGNGNGETETFYSDNREKFDDTEKDDLHNFHETFDSNYNSVGTEHYRSESESLQNSQKDDNGEESYDNYNTDRSDRFGSQLGQRDTETYNNNNRFDSRFTDDMSSRYTEQNKLDSRQDTYDNRAYKRNDVYGNGKYDDVSSYDNSGADKYEFNSMEEYEKSRLNTNYDP